MKEKLARPEKSTHRFVLALAVVALAGLLLPASAQQVRQLSDSGASHLWWDPYLAADGHAIVARENSSGVEGDGLDLVYFTTDGAVERPIGFFSTWFVDHPNLSADGQTIYFLSSGDPTGDTGCLFVPRIHRIDVDGNLQSLSVVGPEPFFCGCPQDQLHIAAQTDQAVFLGCPPSGDQVQRIELLPETLHPVLGTTGGGAQEPRISGDAQWVVNWATFQDTGGNPGGVSLMRADGSDFTNVDPAGSEPDISDDGRYIAWESGADLVGQNSDNSREIYLYDRVTATTTQLTDFAAGLGDNRMPRVSGNGEWIHFLSDIPIFGIAPTGPSTTDSFGYRVHRETLSIEMVFAHPVVFGTGTRDPNEYEVGSSGDQVAYVSQGDPTGENPDGGREVFFVDLSVPSTFEVGADTPTVISWSLDPRAPTWDVVRGDIAELADGGGATVSLGNVTCLADDLADLSTSDPVQPAPGQGFFYLRRGAAGSYGLSSGGESREALSGDCNPS